MVIDFTGKELYSCEGDILSANITKNGYLFYMRHHSGDMNTSESYTMVVLNDLYETVKEMTFDDFGNYDEYFYIKDDVYAAFTISNSSVTIFNFKKDVILNEYAYAMTQFAWDKFYIAKYKDINNEDYTIEKIGDFKCPELGEKVYGQACLYSGFFCTGS